LEKYQIRPEKIEFEVTEPAMINNIGSGNGSIGENKKAWF
jgi:EAL domain-containing protein (putative c-di-GMP-specific phosphodiesterase class I)